MDYWNQDLWKEALKELVRLFRNKNALHGNDYEKWDLRKPSVNRRLWSLRNIFKKGHYAY